MFFTIYALLDLSKKLNSVPPSYLFFVVDCFLFAYGTTRKSVHTIFVSHTKILYTFLPPYGLNFDLLAINCNKVRTSLSGRR